MLALSSRHSSRASLKRIATAAAALALVACSSDTTSPFAPGFLGGTPTNHEVGVVVNSLGKSLTLFQLGSPTTTRTVALGTSSTVTPTGFSLRGRRAAVPLGDAASVAVINLETQAIQRFFLFKQGNATGSVFTNDTTVVAANLLSNIVGRFTVNQVSDTIKDTVTVAPQPTAVAFASGRALVISANLDARYVPIGNGIVTAVDPTTMQVIDSVHTDQTNSTDGAIGPDGLLYVLNTGDYVNPGSITIIDPTTLAKQETVSNMGVGPGQISIDANGLAYISGFLFGTIVWDTKTHTFMRGADHPVCAALAAGGCRGAFAATTNAAGQVYQAFFGSPSDNLPPYVFVYDAGTFALKDSVVSGAGPASIAVRTF